VRPHRLDGHGVAWRLLEEHREQIQVWVAREDLTTVKVGQLLARRGVAVPARTLDRFVTELCGPRRGRAVTVRVADGQPAAADKIMFDVAVPLWSTEDTRMAIPAAVEAIQAGQRRPDMRFQGR
jgi:hypothetical protein